MTYRVEITPTAEGINPPPPMACTTRAATRNQIDGASPHNSDPSVNMPTQNRNTCLRPSESLSLPASGSMMICVIWYAVIVQATQMSGASKAVVN